MSLDIAARLTEANDKVDAAIAADEAGDPARAVQLLEQAGILIAMIPDSKLEEESFSWDREAINNAIAAIKRRSAGSSGIKTQEVRYARG
jgi:hypothetical protein